MENYQRIGILKNEIIELIRSEENKRLNYSTVKQVFLNRGYTPLEFIKASNALKMENRINMTDKELWLTE